MRSPQDFDFHTVRSNMPIKLSVRPVTHLAVASCALVRPAAYRRRWTPMNGRPNAPSEHTD